MIAGKAKQVLLSSSIDEVNRGEVFAYKIPPTNQTHDNKIQFLFTDISQYPIVEGSDKFRGYEEHLNLKVFFPSSYGGDFTLLQNNIIKEMKKNGYRFHDSSGVTGLPDSDRAMLSLQFWYDNLMDVAL